MVLSIWRAILPDQLKDRRWRAMTLAKKPQLTSTKTMVMNGAQFKPRRCYGNGIGYQAIAKHHANLFTV